MAKQGFARCLRQEPWRFLPPTASCASHATADQEVTAARVKWLAGSSSGPAKAGG